MICCPYWWFVCIAVLSFKTPADCFSVVHWVCYMSVINCLRETNQTPLLYVRLLCESRCVCVCVSLYLTVCPQVLSDINSNVFFFVTLPPSCYLYAFYFLQFTKKLCTFRQEQPESFQFLGELSLSFWLNSYSSPCKWPMLVCYRLHFAFTSRDGGPTPNPLCWLRSRFSLSSSHIFSPTNTFLFMPLLTQEPCVGNA